MTATARYGDARDRFFALNYGLFLHWGLYALDAWQEQDQWRRRRKRDEYSRLATRFDPRRFSPDAWIDLAEECGMQHLVITAKHADGFCLFHSAHTAYHVGHTPYRRDIIAEISEACRRRRFPLGIYYSVVDGHHPAYPHAGRRWEYAGPQLGDTPDKERYLDYLRAQVTELCINYGPLHTFWWDANIAKWRDPSINALIRSLQPGILINNRGFDDGDFGTPEREFDPEAADLACFPSPTEACQALGAQSWGHRAGEDYYTDRHLARGIARIRAKGGNYLLNAGPDADGRIVPEEADTLRRLGAWHAAVREAFTDTTPASQLLTTPDALLTRRGNTFYVVCHRELPTRSVVLRPFTTLPVRATLLNTGEPVACLNDLLPWDHHVGVGYLRLHALPDAVWTAHAPVVRLEFDHDPAAAIASPSAPVREER